VQLIRNPKNLGFAKANNIGIRQSRGEYLFLINSDVVVSDDCFDKLIRHLDEHQDVGMLGPRIIGSNGQVQRSCMGYPTLWNSFTRALALDSLFPQSELFGGQLLTFWRHDERRPVKVINGCFWALRRAAVEEVGLLDERFFIYGEDVDWCKRFTDRGWGIVFFPEAEALHYGGASSSNAPVRFYLEMQRAHHQYWAKHRSRPATDGFLLINVLHHAVRLIAEAGAYPFRHRKDLAMARHKIARNAASVKWAVGAIAQSHSQHPPAAVERTF
jgi:GT2 family glycosyltransferase